MRRTTAVVSTLTALVMSCSAFAADNAAYYCPPGAKFCPAPGSTGIAQADANFGIGAPGPAMAYGAQNALDPASVQLNPGERLIMIAPSTASAGGYQAQPYATASAPMPAPSYPAYPAPVQQQRYSTPPRHQALPPQRPVYAGQQQQSWQAAAAPAVYEPSQAERVYNGQKRVRQAESEVANETSSRNKKEIVANDEKVPWYKGGMWRNKKDKDEKPPKNDKKKTASAKNRARDEDDYDDEFDDDPVAARKTASASSNSNGRQAPRLMNDDPSSLWDDEEEDEDYSGYNADGSFGRQNSGGNQNQAARPPAGNPNAPFGNGPQGGGFDGGMDLYASDPTGFAGPVQTAGASNGNYCPPETYPDPYRTGQVSQYGPFDTSNYGGNETYHPSPVTSNTDYSTGGFVNGQTYSDPYASSYTPPPSTGYYPPAGYDSYTGGGFPMDSGGYTAGNIQQTPQYPDYTTQPAQMTSYQSSPSLSGGSSPQFENAVRMVKDNRFSEAKAILAAETNRNPSNAAAWRWLADCHYNLLELDDAIICYQQSLERDSNDYFALRGQGFSYLHRGHEYWRRMQEQVGKGEKEEAASTFALAHDDYKKSLELLGLCLRRNPTDGEAIFGEAMAAEGASRKLYSNALSYLKLGPGQRERAELFAENCMTVINKGIERSKERAKMNPGDAGPRALMGGLYLRKATLYHQLGKNDLALIELRNARDVQKSIIEEIDKNNATARKSIQECEALWEQWGGNRS